jgi:hypothetical protein
MSEAIEWAKVIRPIYKAFSAVKNTRFKLYETRRNVYGFINISLAQGIFDAKRDFGSNCPVS